MEIKDIKEFEKLFSINIPVYEPFDYYIKTLSNSREFYNLKHYVYEFYYLESCIQSLGYKSITNYKLDFAMNSLLKKIKESRAYNRLESFDYSKFILISKDELKNNLETSLISFDLKHANFYITKAFQIDSDEYDKHAADPPEYCISQSWQHLCDDLEINRSLSLSKSFRQLVFGNLNPKRIQKTQHVVMVRYQRINSLACKTPEPI